MRKSKEKMEADQKRAKKRSGEKGGRSAGAKLLQNGDGKRASAKPLQNGNGRSAGAKPLQNGDRRSAGVKPLQNSDGKSAGAAKKGVSAVGKPVKREKSDAAEKGIRAKGIHINDGVMTQNEPDAALSAHTVIIGAGASGLAAAIFAGRNSDVLVVDGNDRVGRKLYATGNGRCNFTNANCSSDDYNQAADGFVDEVFDVFSPRDTLRLFQSLGMMARLEEGGRYYPYSGQAASLVNVLSRTAERSGCRFLLSDRAVKAEQDRQTGGSSEQSKNSEQGGTKESAGFSVELESGRKIFCDRLVIACGGRAGLKTGSTGDGYGFAKAFGHTLAAPRPALTAAESEDAFLSDLKGVRAKGCVSLCRNGEKIAEDSGEIQFTGSGVSGICVFNLTRYMEAARPHKRKEKKAFSSDPDFTVSDRSAEVRENPENIEGKPSESIEDKLNEKTERQAPEYEICCDFVPELSYSQLLDIISKQMPSKKRTCGRNALYEVLTGIVNDKLARVITELSAEGGERQKQGAVFEGQEYMLGKRAAHLLKNLKISVLHTKGWNEAQVTCGGVRRSEIEPRTMESKLVKGLYFCGEVVDVDGKCGGYNLQWAWSSGAAAGMSAGAANETTTGISAAASDETTAGMSAGAPDETDSDES